MYYFGLNPHSYPFGYWLASIFSTLWTRIFYRKAHVIGLENIPKTGPVIICGTHKNMITDSLLLYVFMPRIISFITADIAWKNPHLKAWMDILPNIKIKRPIDYAKKGTGMIKSINGNIVTAIGAKFTNEAVPKSTIEIRRLRAHLVVTNVIDDNTVEVENVKNLKEEDINMEYLIVPKLNQIDLYSNVWQALKDGKAIGIFPEGISCDLPSILPLKPGAASFCYGAKVAHNIDVPVIVCGMNGKKLHKFRSTIFVEFRKPFYRSDRKDEVELYRNRETSSEAIKKFMEQLQEEMEAVYIHAPTYPEWKAIYVSKNICFDTIPDKVEEIGLLHKIKDTFAKYRDSQEAKLLISDINEFHQTLKADQLQEWMVHII